MHHARRIGLAALLTGVLVSGCSSDDAGDDASGTTTEVPAETTTTEGTGRPSPTTDAASSSSVEGSVAVDQEVEHPAGISVKVTGIAAEGNGVYVDIEAFNGSNNEVDLAYLPQYTRLSAGQDENFEWRAPDDNPSLNLPAGAELDARLAFVGRLAEDDGPLRLRLNWHDGGPADAGQVQPRLPAFEFTDLPLPEGE